MKMQAEAHLSLPNIGLFFAVLGAAALVWLCWPKAGPGRGVKSALAQPVIEKQPLVFSSRTFDPDSPPADMPPLGPGEQAMCDSNFVSNASVGGSSRQTDATHAIVTITQVRMQLQLSVTTWVPAGASDHVIEHEDGHRQISEAYYRDAEKAAERIAARYIGQQQVISAADIRAEVNTLLRQLSADITAEYEHQIDPKEAQLRFDAITDHARNDTSAQEAVAEVLRDAGVKTAERSQPQPTAGN